MSLGRHIQRQMKELKAAEEGLWLAEPGFPLGID